MKPGHGREVKLWPPVNYHNLLKKKDRKGICAECKYEKHAILTLGSRLGVDGEDLGVGE